VRKMAIQFECPKCGSMDWVIYGVTNPTMITGFRCDVCWYEEKYVEPEDRQVCGYCDVQKKSLIGKEEPKYYHLYMKRCPKCRTKLNLSWDKRKEFLEIMCPKCFWRDDKPSTFKLGERNGND